MTILWLAISLFAGFLNAQPAMPGTLVDVGGYRVHLYCTGSGSPTVVVVGGGFSFDWGLVQPEVARFTKICTYDPSGTAWSDAVLREMTCSKRVAEIHEVLLRASIGGPYVITGFSIGGLYGRLFVRNYPEEVAGMVIVDHAFIDPGSGGAMPRSMPSFSGVDTPPVLVSQSPISLGIEDDQNFQRLPRRNRDLHMWALSRGLARPTADTAAECIAVVEGLTAAQPYPLGMRPLVVISTNNSSPAYQTLQTKLLALSHDSKQMIAEQSTHMVIVDAPETIVTAIDEVVTAIRIHGVSKK